MKWTQINKLGVTLYSKGVVSEPGHTLLEKCEMVQSLRKAISHPSKLRAHVTSSLQFYHLGIFHTFMCNRVHTEVFVLTLCNGQSLEII